MEGSTSKTPRQSEANSSNADKGWENIITYFGSIELGKDGTLITQPSLIQSNNAVPSSSSFLSDNAPSVEEDFTGNKDNKLVVPQVTKQEQEGSSQGIEIDELPASLDMTEWLSISSVLQENIWAQPNIYNDRGMTLAENHHSDQGSLISSSTSYTDNDLNHPPPNFDGSLRGRTRASSVYRDSSIQNPAPSDGNYQSYGYHPGNYMINGFRNFSSVTRSQFDDHQLRQIPNGGYYTNNNITSSAHFPYQDRMEYLVRQNLSLTARTHRGSEMLIEILQSGNYESTQLILDRLLDSILQLMIDDNGHHVFGMLVEKCQNDQLWSIVSQAASEPDMFTRIAFIDKGSKSIQRLIKKLKRTPMAQIITGILSRRSYELMTNKTGSHVIRQCFIILGEKPNLILYDAISSQLLDLATDRVGCVSLNCCVSNITGPRRGALLGYLAVHSLFLSNDPSGNFVVQHVLDLANELVTKRILCHLEGNFKLLAQKKGGSHVVEKCMRSSPEGLEIVVREILEDGNVLFRLAGDTFGNYVVQTALKWTKIKNQALYQELLEALRPHYSSLRIKRRGRHVAELIKEDLGLQ